jgi:hypothetical protein
VRRRSCRHLKSNACKERGCRAEKVELKRSRLDLITGTDGIKIVLCEGVKKGVRSSGKS